MGWGGRRRSASSGGKAKGTPGKISTCGEDGADARPIIVARGEGMITVGLAAARGEGTALVRVGSSRRRVERV